MRRRAAFYLLLGVVSAALIIVLATAVETGRSARPDAWIWAHRHVPLLQMIDLSAGFLCVVIGIYGLTVNRLQIQIVHQSEDFDDQMQSLMHRNEELERANEEYAEQIAAIEGAGRSERPALSRGDTGQRVVAALHWQVESQAQQIEAVHRALDSQQTMLDELRRSVGSLADGGELRLSGAGARGTRDGVADAESDSEHTAAACPTGTATEAAAKPAVHEPEKPAPRDTDAGRRSALDSTANGLSTLIGDTLDFDLGAPAVEAEEAPLAVAADEQRTYPVGSTLLAVAAGHLSSMPEPEPYTPTDFEGVEVTVSRSPARHASSEPPENPPERDRNASALDRAESALSSVQADTDERLTSLRAELASAHAPMPGASAEAAPPEPAARRKRWHMRL